MWASSQQTAVRAEESAERKALVAHDSNRKNGVLQVLKPHGLRGGLISLGAGIALLYYGRSFFVTLSIAVTINFILEPFVGMLIRVRAPRALASLIVCLFAVCVILLAGVGVYNQVARLAGDLPKYADRIGDLSDLVLTKLDSVEQATQTLVARRRPSQPARKPPARRRSTYEPVIPVAAAPGVQEVHIQPERPPIMEFIHANLGALSETLMLASFLPFLVYFMLSWRDHIRPAFLSLFEGPDRIAAATSLDGIASMVRAFVFGNFILSVMLAFASTVLFWAFRLPHPLLIGPVSGILSLVPSFGLLLALAPPLLAALTVYSNPASYLAIVGGVALFHLVAMNLLYPKIVGRRVHLNPLVVVVAMMFWSVLWGPVGLILAIPLTAGIKATCEHVQSLECYGRILGD